MILGFIIFFSIILIPVYYYILKNYYNENSYSIIKEAEDILKNKKDKRDDKRS
jgi:cbb3-type cytochrome oxidase subunit 3